MPTKPLPARSARTIGPAPITPGWDEARALFERACELDECAEAVDGLGRALHFQGEYARAIELTERAFGTYRREDRPLEAADRAPWLAFLHGAVNANMAVDGGWMARGREPPGGRRRVRGGTALAIARRFGDSDPRGGGGLCRAETARRPVAQ